MININMTKLISKGWNKMRILVVEDEKALCESIAKGLRLDGYEVDMVFDGEEAMDIIFKNKSHYTIP